MRHKFPLSPQHNHGMKTGNVDPIAYVEILDGRLAPTFNDGQGAFRSADVMHHAIDEAKELPEFSVIEREAMMAWSDASVKPKPK